MERGEAFRGGVHAIAGGIVAAMCIYNLMEYHRKGGRHHIINTMVYGPLWGFEIYQTFRHWRRCDDSSTHS